MTQIHITQITSESERWIRTWDGYREIEKFGNRHAKFVDSEWVFLLEQLIILLSGEMKKLESMKIFYELLDGLY